MKKMRSVGKLIYTNKEGYKVYLIKIKEKSAIRIKYEFYLETPQGELSETVSIKRSSIKNGTRWSNFIYDFEGDFDEDDIMEIEEVVKEVLTDKTTKAVEDFEQKSTVKEIYEIVCQYINDNIQTDKLKNLIFVEENCGFIETKAMSDLLVKYKEELNNKKRTDILKCLQILGVLLPCSSRGYDYQKDIEGEKKRFYRILLPENVEGDKKRCA